MHLYQICFFFSKKIWNLFFSFGKSGIINKINFGKKSNCIFNQKHGLFREGGRFGGKFWTATNLSIVYWERRSRKIFTTDEFEFTTDEYYGLFYSTHWLMISSIFHQDNPQADVSESGCSTALS